MQSRHRALLGVLIGGIVLLLFSAELLGQYQNPLTVTGPTLDRLFGFSTAVIGDIDNDGIADFIVGAPSFLGQEEEEMDCNHWTNNVGHVYVYSGRTGTQIRDHSEYCHQGTHEWWIDHGRYGWSVAAAGDVNGDNVPDYIIGAPYWWNAAQEIYSRGAVEVISGATGNSIGSRLLGPQVNTPRFGWSVAGIGDVNGDSRSDIVVGSPYDSPAKIYVYSFGTDNQWHLLYTRSGNYNEATFGKSVSGVADLDGDNRPDILVASESQGLVYVFSGNTGSLIQAMSSFAGELRVCGIGDVNGDGRGDFVVGEYGQGHVHLYSGMTRGILATYSGSGSFGIAVSAGGDFNNDNIPDVVIGQSGGNAYVYSCASPYGLLHVMNGTGDFGSSVAGPKGTANDGYGLTVGGAPSANTATVFAYGFPEAEFSGVPLSGLRPLQVTFTDHSTRDATGWSWNFGDGGTSTDRNPVHTYTEGGQKNVSLIVTGRNSVTDTETKNGYVNVTIVPPVANFTGTPRSGYEPLVVTFTNQSTNPIDSWHWDFGDGTTYDGQTPPPHSYSYGADGRYTVSLTVTGPDGTDTETKANYISVQKRADFTATPRVGVSPLSVTFTGLCNSGTATTWHWHFGDGSEANGQTVVHNYTTPGSDTVELAITGTGFSDSEVKPDFIAVQAAAHENWEVKIQSVPSAMLGATVPVSVLLTAPEHPMALGSFDLRFRWDPSVMSFGGTDMNNSLYSRCGWEYYTWRYFSSPVTNVRVYGYAELTGNGTTPGCFYPTGTEVLFRINFLLTNQLQYADDWYDISFYWPYGSGLDQDTCLVNTFQDRWLSSRFMADGVYTSSGSQIPAGTPNWTPRPYCLDQYPRWFDFYDGFIYIAEETGNPERGDVNLDGWRFDISDLVFFTNYFVYGLVVFGPGNPDYEAHIAATDIDCDSVPLTLADYTLMTRIIIGDVGPQCPTPPPAAKATVVTDTLKILSAVGNPGETNKKIEIYLKNDATLAGFQSRFVFDPVALQPVFDYASGDSHSVRYELAGRAAGYTGGGGDVLVKSPEAGVLLVTFLPDQYLDAQIPTGSGTVIKVYFNIPSSAPLGIYEYWPEAEGYQINQLVTPLAYGITPMTADGFLRVRRALPPPSCPVLFTLNGTEFAQENPLLTACEKSGYKDVVTDYYHLTTPMTLDNGSVRFQLRELENEITYISDLKLMTVDHSKGSQLAVSSDGSIMTFNKPAIPLSAFDDKGMDRLAELQAVDGNLFAATEPGYLDLTFPNDQTGAKGFTLNTAAKYECPIVIENPIDPGGGGFRSGGNDGKPGTNELKVQVLNDQGEWMELPQLPSRENTRQEVVVSGLTEQVTGKVLTLRVSWNHSYTTDAIGQLVPSQEQPIVETWSINRGDLAIAGKAASNWNAFDGSSPLVLKKGDVFEFGFTPSQLTASDLMRDYVIVAKGRYEPDYAVYANLLPKEITLFDNYPNPFNPTTAITYSLPEAGQVNLEVLNVLGQRVATLVDDYQPAGFKKVEWNADSFASGMYFYRLKVGDVIQTKKMLLLK